MNKSIYPIGGAERNLPVYLKGIGLNDYQFDLIRKDGYPDPQIIYCTRGKGRVLFDDKEYIITPDMCFFLPAKYPHKYYTIGDLWETHWVTFDGFAVDSILDTLNFAKPEVFTLSSIQSLETLFQQMFVTLKNDRIYGEFSCSGLIYDFLLELHRLAFEKNNEELNNKNSLLLPVLDYIENNYHLDIDLSQLCSIASCTPQHICRLFKKRIGMRPLEYIAKKRIQYAKELLLSGDIPIFEISSTVGYNDVSYFSAIFKRYEKVSPSEYRKAFK